MLWFILALALAMVIIPSIALARFGKGPADISEKSALRAAKTVIEGKFKKGHFGQKPLKDLFPTKKTCPHCGGRRGKAWDFASAEKLLDDMVGLARQIKRRELCRSCLEQLSEITKVRGHFEELKEEDPQSLPSKVGRAWVPSLVQLRARVPSLLVQLGVVIFAVSAFSALFLHEVRVAGILRLEVVLLLASLALFALGTSWKVLRALFRRFGWPVLVAVTSFMAIMLAGVVVR